MSKKERKRMTPTSWSVVRYVVQGEVGKRYGRKEWIDVNIDSLVMVIDSSMKNILKD